MAKNEVAAISEEEAFDLAAYGVDVTQYAGVGNENVSSNDIAIPYISILQKMSPMCDDDSPDRIPDAKPGMFFQNVNKFLWDKDETLEIIPVAFNRNIIEWVPREKGGGLVAVHDLAIMDQVAWEPNDKKIPCRKDNGNLLVDTAQHIVLYRSQLTGFFEPAMVSMKSTNLKKSRLWNSLISQQTIPGTNQQAPRWLYIWKATTVREEKDGNSWYNWEFARGEIVDKETFLKADRLHKASKAGQVRGQEHGDGNDDSIPF